MNILIKSYQKKDAEYSPCCHGQNRRLIAHSFEEIFKKQSLFFCFAVDNNNNHMKKRFHQ
jgi:hypothetical protein